MAYDLYVITDTVAGRGRSHEEMAGLAIEGGADVVQLRDKACSARDLVMTGRRIKKITKRSGTLFIVNDRLDVALACGADGVHLGQDDIPPASAREMAPEGFVIGVSAATGPEAVQAVRDGADYIAASPVFPTPSKPDAHGFCGLEGIRAIRKAVGVPLVAIGGIGLHNAGEAVAAGADGVAVISAVIAQPDIAKAARELRKLVTAAKRQRDAFSPGPGH